MTSRLIGWQETEHKVQEILRQISASRWHPDCVVGISRGGLVPATMISHYLQIPMHTLAISLRDHNNECEHNLWLAEDAAAGTNMLIIDDINDTGNTLNWLVKDWQQSVSTNEWVHIWNNTVRFATLVDKTSSKFKFDIDFTAEEMTPESDKWLDFPWESWWRQ